MCGDDADVACSYLDQLDVACRPAREGKPLGRQAAQPPGVVGRLVGREQVGWLGKLVDAYAVLQYGYDVFFG
jgi:hypothetical protein